MTATMMASVLMTIYIFFSAIWPLRLRWWAKAALTLVLAMAAGKFHLLHLFGGPLYFAPDLPGWLLLLSAWAFATVLFFFTLLLMTDAGRWIYRLVLKISGRKFPVERFRRINARFNLGVLAVAAVVAAVGAAAGTALPEIREVDIVLPGLPPEAAGFRIAVLSDLHIDNLIRSGRVEAIVKRVNAAEPDLIVITGDIVDGEIERRSRDTAPLANLHARFGVFGVPGNHDCFSGFDEWMTRFRELGITMLLNEHRAIPETGLVVGGVTDPAARRYGGAAPDPAAAFEGVPDGVVKILLAHRPNQLPEAAQAGVALQISGHTHGGMVIGLDRLVGAFNGGLVSGLYRRDGTVLYITNGSGMWSGFPIRIGVPSEITLIRLLPETAERS